MATRDAPVTSPRIAATRAADRVGVGLMVMPVNNVPITDTVTPARRLADEAAAVDRNTPVRLYERLVPVTSQHRVLPHAAHDQLPALDELIDGPVPAPELCWCGGRHGETAQAWLRCDQRTLGGHAGRAEQDEQKAPERRGRAPVHLSQSRHWQ